MAYPGGGDADEGQRQSMTRTYLPRATAAGARLLCDHRVDRLVWDGKRAFRAELTDPEGGPVTVDFGDVFVCAGAIQTPALLQRSGRRGLVGRSLNRRAPIPGGNRLRLRLPIGSRIVRAVLAGRGRR